MKIFFLAVLIFRAGGSALPAFGQEQGQEQSADTAASSTVDKSTAAQEAPIWRRRRRARYKNSGKTPAAPPKRKGPVVELGGRWLPENKKALEKLIFDLGFPAPGEPEPEVPPAAVFILDNCSIIHHAGEAIFYRMVTDAKFKFDENFWPLLPPPFNYKIRMGYVGFKEAPRVVWPRNPYYMTYRKSMFEAYQMICGDQGTKACHSWLASLLNGFKADEIGPFMAGVVESEEKRKIGGEIVPGDIEDQKPARFPVGLEAVPEIKQLIAELLRHGFDVRLMSSSNQWAAEAIAGRLGVAADHVDGIRVHVSTKTSLLTDKIDDLFPEGADALAVATSRLGRAPALIFAVGKERELLNYGGGLRMILEPTVPGLPPPASINGWLVQPAFLPGGPPIHPASAKAKKRKKKKNSGH